MNGLFVSMIMCLLIPLIAKYPEPKPSDPECVDKFSVSKNLDK